MTRSTELSQLLLASLCDVPGLVPARPATVPSGLPWDADLLAVEVDGDLVTMRLVARELPLPPLLRQASEVLGAALAAHGYGGVRLRLEVADLDQAAFGRARAGGQARRARRARAGTAGDGSATRFTSAGP